MKRVINEINIKISFNMLNSKVLTKNILLNWKLYKTAYDNNQQ